MRPKSPTFLLAAALLLAAAAPSRAQLDNLLTGYSLTSWNEGDGHPLGTVYAMVQDPQGYLWLGTDAGLFRFDGSRFTAWNTMSDAPLPPVAVVAFRARGPPCRSRQGSALPRRQCVRAGRRTGRSGVVASRSSVPQHRSAALARPA